MTTDNNDARVTNAVLGVEMVHVKKSLDRLDGTIADAVGEMKDQAKRTTDVEKCLVGLKVQVDTNSKLTQKWDIANSALGLMLATALAYIGLRN
jgi:hypothetical protein